MMNLNEEMLIAEIIKLKTIQSKAFDDYHSGTRPKMHEDLSGAVEYHINNIYWQACIDTMETIIKCSQEKQ